jgi:taurine dioxygenase
MRYEIRPVSDHLGVEVRGLDLTEPMDEDAKAAVNKAFVDNVVLVFRDQDITAPQFFEAAKQLGEPMPQQMSQFKVPECPMVSYISNQEKEDDGKPKLLGQEWHTDHSFRPEPPKATMLHGIELPKQGGNTWFANMRLAYEKLPDALKQRIEGLKAVHAFRDNRSGLSAEERAADMARHHDDNPNVEEVEDGIVHPVVRTHDVTGARAIYINPLRIKRFIGLGPDESTELLAALTEHATGDDFTYAHAWRQGDVVIWDNRQSLHRVVHNYDLAQKRLMHRIILKGQRPA